MNSNELIFYPIIRKAYTNVAKARKPMFIAYAVLALFLTIFLKAPWWVFFILLIPGGIGCFMLSWTVSDANAWDCGGYEVVEINEFHKYLLLDDLKINFDEIDYAEVVIDDHPNYMLSSGFTSAALINSKILIHMQDRDRVTIPVQYKGVLGRMVTVLKKHIAIKYDKDKISDDDPLRLFLVLLLIGVLSLICGLLFPKY